MAGRSGSNRSQDAALRAAQREREKAARLAEQQRRARERESAQAEAVARDQEAESRTRTVDARVEQLETLLVSALRRNPCVDLKALRRKVEVPPLDLTHLAPQPSPDWSQFQPIPPGALGRLFGGERRYRDALLEAERAFEHESQRHQRQESERQAKVREARRAHDELIVAEQHKVEGYNAGLDRLATGLQDGERHAVSTYFELVLKGSPYPDDFPTNRRAAYVPESSLLAVEWYLPPVEAVPDVKTFRHVKGRKAVESTARPQAEIAGIYQRVIAQIALRTLREVFTADRTGLIDTVVFNGRVKAVDPTTGQRIQPHLITLRATREQFTPLVLDEPKFKPVDCVRRYFFADVSQHPDELVPVEPVMAFEMADPRIVDPVDVISDIDKRPNLLELTPKEFEAFIQNLFAKMGFDTKLYRASGDGGIDCVAYDPHPITGGKFIVQAKLYTKTVQPAHVRDLWGRCSTKARQKAL